MKKNIKESITGDIDMDFGRTNYSKDDYVKGVADLEREALDNVKSKLADIVIDYAKIQKEDVKKIADFLMKTFGTTKPQLNKENAKKLSNVLGLDSILAEGFKEGENIGVKIIGRIKQLLGLNIYAWAGLPLAVTLGGIYGFGAGVIALIGGWALLGIFTKIMEKFGYGNGDTDVAGIGYYNPEKDIRGGSAEDIRKYNSGRLSESKNKMTVSEFKQYVISEAKKLYQAEIIKESVEKKLSILKEESSAMGFELDPETLKKVRQDMIKKAAGWDFSQPQQLDEKKKYSDKASNFIGKEISHLEKDKGYKHDRAVAAAINVAKDKGYKVPKKTNESEAPSAGLTKKEKSNVVKKAKAGEDIGKKGKGFEDVAAKAAKQYGSKEKGEKVAAAAMWKNIKRK